MGDLKHARARRAAENSRRAKRRKIKRPSESFVVIGSFEPCQDTYWPRKRATLGLPQGE